MHISLDSALGRQRRLNQVGETISSIAAPTAAYSLRSITGGDPKAVRVRRSSNITAEPERDFTASEVSSGALVNFVNEIQTLGTVTNSVGNNGFTLTNASSTGFTATLSSGTGVCGWAFTAESGDKVTVSFDAVVRSGSPQFLPRKASALSGSNLATVVSDSALNVTTGSFSFEFTYNSNDAGSLTFSEGDAGSDFDISNFQVTAFKGGGFVSKWYDQSGNGNDLTQATSTKQPIIVTSGVISTRNSEPIVKFIQANSTHLTNDNVNMFPTGSNIAATVFHAMHIDVSSSGRLGIFGGNGGGNNAEASAYRFGSGTGRRVIIKFADASSTQFELNSNAFTNNADSILTYQFAASGGTGSLQAFNNGSSNGSVSTSITDQSYGPSHVSSGLILGSRTTGDNFSDCEFFEVIVYASDQLSNRDAIEANLSSKYGITLS